VSSGTGIPICIDEGLTTVSDARILLQYNLAQYFNIKVPKCGGLRLAERIASLAVDAGVTCVCGGALALEVVRQASRHFAASVYLGDKEMCSEGAGPASQELVGDVARTVVTYEDVRCSGGSVRVSDAPGLGVDLDWNAIERYAC
jgi:L-alanine-DL-glutamate epimerase-like enolase superfamily enzyme